jgi:hypothetical protein
MRDPSPYWYKEDPAQKKKDQMEMEIQMIMTVMEHHGRICQMSSLHDLNR